MTVRNEYTVCPACETKNSTDEEYCLKCGQKLTESSQNEIKSDEKLKISKDSIILLDLNYTLISNSWDIRFDKLPQKIYNRNMNMNWLT